MIVAIQSFTDVITNSSSTVFIMHQADAKYYKKEHPSDIEIEKILWIGFVIMLVR